MKRLSKFHTAFCVLLFPLALVLAACATQTSGNTSTWQEQYDLGMRYLTESNYEEAILAFTAAIEIDPKQADPYVYLTQAYLALGNAEQAETTRLQGYEATGNVRLSQSVRSGWSIIYDDDIAFEQRIIYRDFHLMSTAQQDTLCQAIEAIQVDNQDAVRDILLNSDFPGQLCTTYNGYKINIFVFNKEEYKAYLDSYYGYMMQQGNISSEDGRVAGAEQAVGIELRPEHGRGYSYAWFKNMDFTISQSEVDTTALPQVDFEMASTFDCSSWQGNGTWTRQVTMLQEIDGYLHNTNMEESGSITNNLVTVELRQGQIDADGQSWIIVYGEGKVNTYTIIDGQTYNWPVVWLEDSLAEAENFVPYTIDLGYF